MPNLFTRIKQAQTLFSLKGPPEAPHTGAYQRIVEKEQEEVRYLSDQEIQTLMGWDNAQMATAAPGLTAARAIWARYQRQLAEYERKQAKREARRQSRAPVQPKEAPVSQPGGAEVIEGESQTVQITSHEKAFSEWTADELSARRRSILANTPFDLSFHRKFMNGIKELWRVVGPIAFVVFTVWEVFYFMNHFLQASNIFDVVLLWGISLIIEIPFMMATYDQAERRERAEEKRARGENPTIHGTYSSMGMWCVLALVNVAGQIAFLAFVTKAGYSLASPQATGLWGFILLRVSGVIVGDTYTAFHLLPTEADIDRVLRAQKAQMDGEKRLAESDAERLHKDAESQRAIRQIQLSVKRDEREAQFMEDWQKMNMRQALARQQRFMELENQQLRQLGGGEGRELDTGDLE